MPGTVAKLKSLFFDRDAVRAATTRAENKALSRFGAFVRRRVKSSLRYRDRFSAPGSPPSVHRHWRFRKKKVKDGKVTSTKLSQFRELVFFAYVPGLRSVVIGPALLNGAKNTNPTVPQLHEEGGTVPGNNREITVARKPGRDAAGRFVSRGFETIKLTGVLHYPPRPYMRPAYLAELPRAAELFKNMIR